MIPAFLLPLALKLSPVGRFLKAIPRPVWIALAILALLALGSCVHSRKVKAFGEERYAAGVAYEQARIAKKAEVWVEKINDIAAKQRSKNSEANRHIAADYDALRLRGAGKAACPYAPAPAASRYQSPGRPADAPLAPLPDRERIDLIGLPLTGTLAFGEQCDLNRQEVIDRREAERLQLEAWKKAGGVR